MASADPISLQQSFWNGWNTTHAIPPPAPGQLRRWVDRRELRALLEPEFEVEELFSVTPRLARRTMARIKAIPVGLGRAAVPGGAKARGSTNHSAGLGGRALRWWE